MTAATTGHENEHDNENASGAAASSPEGADRAAFALRYGLTLGLAGAAGFIALSYEIVWYRAFAFVSWAHPTVFGLLLAFYLLGVALGSAATRPLCRSAVRADEEPRALRALAAFVFFANLVGFVVVPALGRFATTNWLPAFGLVALSAGLMGAVLPLVAHFGIAPDDRAGSRLSWVYLANIVGSSSGSFLTGFVLMDVWSTQKIGVFLALLGFAMVAVLLAFAARGRAGVTAISLAAVALSAGACVAVAPRLYDKLYERLLWKTKFTDDVKLVHVLENRHGVIVVNDYSQVYGGGAYDGAFNVSLVDDKNVVERAFAVAAMHPSPRRVLVIGLSSGSWTQIISNLSGVEDVTVIEINPGYVELIQKYEPVRTLLQNPKVHIVVDDGRRWLHRHPDQKFDVIVMNTSYHWRSHTTNLLSREFLELARAHLLPGGLHYFNTTSSEEAQRTASLVFPNSLRVINFMAVSDSPIVFDKDRWRRALTDTKIDGKTPLDLTLPRDQELLARFMQFADTIDGPPVFLGLERRESILKKTDGLTTITDDNVASEWKARFKFPLIGNE